jgi:FkbM family methyltransferase
MISKIKQFVMNKLISKLEIPNIQKSLNHLKKLGFNPAVIFDVGAYKGDFAILSKKIWENTNIICFEPLSEKVKLLNELSKKINGIKVIEGVVGEENKIIDFNESETASSCLTEQNEQGFPVTKKQMNTLKNYIVNNNLNIPNLLKIDTQGYEYQVLSGTLEVIDKIEVILAELNFIDIHKNVSLAAEVIQMLNKHNFVIFDISEIHRRPLDNSIWQADFIFVKKDSFLRNNKKWI